MTRIRERADVEWKSGDTTDGRRLQLLDRDGNPVNLNGATVTQHAFGPSEHAGEAPIDNPEQGVIIPNREGLIPEGNYQDWLLEYWVTYANGEKQPFPEIGFYRARVWKGRG